MKKSLLWIVISVVSISMIVLFSLSSCAPAVEEPVVEEPVAEEPIEEEITTEPITLNLWCISDGVELLRSVIELYQKEHPNVDATYTGYEIMQIRQVVPSTLASGSKDVDLIMFWGGLPTNVLGDYLIDLMPYAEKYNWFDNLYESCKDFITADGKYYSYNLNNNSGMWIYYNKAIFDEVGINPPETIEDLFEISSKIKEAGYIPMAIPDKDKWVPRLVHGNILNRFTSTENAIFYTMWENFPDEEKAEKVEIFNSQEVVDSFNFLDRLNKEGVFVENAGTINDAESRFLFTSGKAAMITIGSWAADIIAREAPELDFGYFAWPASEKYPENREMLSECSDAFLVPASISEEKLPIVIDLIDKVNKEKEYEMAWYKAGIAAATFALSVEETESLGFNPMVFDQMGYIKEHGSIPFNGTWWSFEGQEVYGTAISNLLVGTMTPEEATEYIYSYVLGTLDLE